MSERKKQNEPSAGNKVRIKINDNRSTKDTGHDEEACPTAESELAALSEMQASGEDDTCENQQPSDCEDAGRETGGADHDTGTSDSVSALAQERNELQGRLLRVSADYQNFVKRSQANLSISLEQQIMEVTRDLVTVLDHFDHALEVDPDKTTAGSLIEGMVIVRDELLRTLQRYGLEKIEVKPGEGFDPVRHEALMHQQVEGIASNHVAAQLQPGYAVKGKTIRPAKVSVAQ